MLHLTLLIALFMMYDQMEVAMKKLCQGCGREYNAKPSHAESSKFCSKACHSKAKVVRKIVKTCPNCLGTFEVYPSEADRFTHCSPECRSGLEARFWDRVDVRGIDECWPWKGGVDGAGYGCIKVRGVQQAAHRISFEQHFGKIPAGLVVRHWCDNPICENPYHLLLGTHQQNMGDKVERGRQPKGSQIGVSKLTEGDIPVVRRLLREDWSQQEIADMFRVKQETISAIARGKTWKHIKEGT